MCIRSTDTEYVYSEYRYRVCTRNKDTEWKSGTSIFFVHDAPPIAPHIKAVILGTSGNHAFLKCQLEKSTTKLKY